MFKKPFAVKNSEKIYVTFDMKKTRDIKMECVNNISQYTIKKIIFMEMAGLLS